MSVDKPHARAFYEAEAIRGGWSVRQLARQIGTQFFERVSASKCQKAMLSRGRKPKPEDAVLARDEVHDPYLLEFLDLKDEYDEGDLRSYHPSVLSADGLRFPPSLCYATGGIRTQVFASKYLTVLPDMETLRREILATQRALEHHAAAKKGKS